MQSKEQRGTIKTAEAPRCDADVFDLAVRASARAYREFGKILARSVIPSATLRACLELTERDKLQAKRSGVKEPGLAGEELLILRPDPSPSAQDDNMLLLAKFS